MAYVSPSSKATGTLITAAIWNQDIVANEQASAPDVFTAKGDLFVGTAADTGAKMAAGTNEYVLIADSAQTAGLKWAQVSTTGLANDAVTVDKIADDAVTADQIADSAVTTARIANDAVDDTKAGDRVPQFYRRQGGDASDWATSGTTDYTPGAVRMQGGSRVVVGPGASSGTVTVTFPVAFSNVPMAFLTDGGNGLVVWSINAGSSSQLTLNWRTTDGSTPALVAVFWMAIGPE
jgi:hypothetical protein